MSVGWSPGKAEPVTVLTFFARRLEFDAYRSDLEEMSLGPRDAAAMVRTEMAQHDYQVHREKYERLRSDVTIKLKFLEENKVCSFLLYLKVFCYCWVVLPFTLLQWCIGGLQDPVTTLWDVVTDAAVHTFDHAQPQASVLLFCGQGKNWLEACGQLSECGKIKPHI